MNTTRAAPVGEHLTASPTATSARARDLIFISGFEPLPGGHGGQRRAAQIHEICVVGNFLPHAFQPTIRRNSPVDLLRAWQALPDRHLATWFRPADLARLGQRLRQLHVFLARCPTAPILYEVNSLIDLMTLQMLVRDGCHVVACPQNVDALVPGDNTGNGTAGQFERLRFEAAALREASAVFCISNEEEWLLNALDVPAHCLPYYPPAKTLAEFEKIRHTRSQKVTEPFFLILGNVANPPTMAGLRGLHRMILECRLPVGVKFKVAGFGTDALKATWNDQRVEVLGAVSDEALSHLYSTAGALLIHQQPTSGVLTRIAEAMVSGIPIIGNPAAVKSAELLAGVYTYRNAAEFSAILMTELTSPSPPVYPHGAAAALLNSLTNF